MMVTRSEDEVPTEGLVGNRSNGRLPENVVRPDL